MLSTSPAHGRISVRAAVQREEAVVTVIDAGPGIGPKEIQIIFEKYRQTLVGMRQEGTGFGPFIAKTLVEAYGGRTVGEGSRFSVFLPLAEADSVSQAD